MAEAEAEFLKALAIDPNHLLSLLNISLLYVFYVRFDLGSCRYYALQNDAESAERYLLHATIVAPENYHVWILLAQVSFALDMIPEALRCASTAAGIRPSSYEPALLVSAIKLHIGRPGEVCAIINVVCFIEWNTEPVIVGTSSDSSSIITSFMDSARIVLC